MAPRTRRHMGQQNRVALCLVLRRVVSNLPIRSSMRLIIALGKAQEAADDEAGHVALQAYRTLPNLRERLFDAERQALAALHAGPAGVRSRRALAVVLERGESDALAEHSGALAELIISLGRRCFYHGSIAVENRGYGHERENDERGPSVGSTMHLLSLGGADGSRVLCTLNEWVLSGCGCGCDYHYYGVIVSALLRSADAPYRYEEVQLLKTQTEMCDWPEHKVEAAEFGGLERLAAALDIDASETGYVVRMITRFDTGRGGPQWAQVERCHRKQELEEESDSDSDSDSNSDSEDNPDEDDLEWKWQDDDRDDARLWKDEAERESVVSHGGPVLADFPSFAAEECNLEDKIGFMDSVHEVILEILDDADTGALTLSGFAPLFEDWQTVVLAETDPIAGPAAGQDYTRHYTHAWIDHVAVEYPEAEADY